MKLYVLQNGTAPDFPREACYSTGKPIDPNDCIAIPTPVFLIEHPKEGYILYDTGWSDRRNKTFEIPKDQDLIPSLARLGVKPEDISHIICSHMHLDHAGSIEFFPNADVIVSNLEFTQVAKNYLLGTLPGTWIRGDIEQWIRQGIRWSLIEGEYELIPYCEGITLIVLGSGHSYGMLALLLDLPETGKLVLASDAIYCTENVGPPICPPGVIQDEAGWRKSLRFLQDVAEREKAALWYGHDMAQFNSLKKADEGCYE